MCENSLPVSLQSRSAKLQQSTSGPEQIAHSLMQHYLQMSAVIFCGLQQNDQQRSLSANQCRIFVSGLNIL